MMATAGMTAAVMNLEVFELLTISYFLNYEINFN
jgi:hypothetical protein